MPTYRVEYRFLMWCNTTAWTIEAESEEAAWDIAESAINRDECGIDVGLLALNGGTDTKHGAWDIADGSQHGYEVSDIWPDGTEWQDAPPEAKREPHHPDCIAEAVLRQFPPRR